MLGRHGILLGLVLIPCLAALGFSASVGANDDGPPSSTEVTFAKEVSDLLVAEIVAALFQEFNETTPQNVPHGKQAISLVFNDLNRDMRLIGAFRPLLGGSNNRPGDRFEVAALRRAMAGDAHLAVQRVNDRWYYRRSVPLSNTLHQACVMCHASFTPEFFQSTSNPGQWVGALVVGVPIRTSVGH